MKDIVVENDFRLWLEPLKHPMRHAQIKASLTVNKELIGLY